MTRPALQLLVFLKPGIGFVFDKKMPILLHLCPGTRCAPDSGIVVMGQITASATLLQGVLTCCREGNEAFVTHFYDSSSAQRADDTR